MLYVFPDTYITAQSKEQVGEFSSVENAPTVI